MSAANAIDRERERLAGARRALSQAQTVTDLSQLAGDLPERCRTGFDAQTCAWRLEPGTRAHETLSALGDTSEAAALHCRLPLDGGPRSAESCSVMPEAAPEG